MYRCILLCYDGSPDGREALREGAEIAARFHAETHLLAISPVFSGNEEIPASPSALDDNRRDYRRILDEGVAELRAAGIVASSHCSDGRPIEVIPSFARTLHADLIVLGHRHQSALARWWHGSVGSSLVHHAPCSILVAVARDTD